MGILSLIAEFENDIRHERQMDRIKKAQERGMKFGRKREVTAEKIAEIKTLREAGITVPDIMRQTGLSKASVYRRLDNDEVGTCQNAIVSSSKSTITVSE
jgi:DNA invertase Pin-like site-specific DNA recombinase